VSAENVRAVLIELQYAVAAGWTVSLVGDLIVVVGPDSRSFRSEVWRLVEFVAYDQYVSIERIGGDSREYAVVSRSDSDLSFRMVIRALPVEVT
jgi:hypothetical protein